jgi:hypothetical protein
MLYKLLGMAVWNGGKLFLRRKYGSTYVPKSVLAGVAVAALAVAGAGVALASRSGDDE